MGAYVLFLYQTIPRRSNTHISINSNGL